jgi:hypothetical protein
MNPADSVIEKLGGVSAVAKATGVHRTRVSNWKRPREAGGTGGRIPQKHFPKLLALAGEIGVELDLAAIVGMASGEAGGAPCG